MEIIVLSGLAYLGHKLSKDKVRNESIPEEKVKKRCNRYPFKNDDINMEKDIGKIPIEKGEEQMNHTISSAPNNVTQDYWSLNAFGDESDYYQPQFMALDPQVTRTKVPVDPKKPAFHNNMVPYFSSGKKQNTNDAL